ncbi:condensation domain-containing protein [Nonomuraea antimicrobica]
MLRQAPAVFRSRINDVLLAALAWALSRWTGRDRVLVNLEGHGREDIFDGVDLTRTVGWFTSAYPVALTVQETDWPALVRSVRGQLRAVPGNGLGFGLLRYLGRRPELAGPGAAEPEVAFNYLGQWKLPEGGAGDGLYHAFHPSLGQDQSPADRAVHPVEIVGAAEGGRLRFTWRYAKDRYDEAAVRAVAADFLLALERIAEHCAGRS